MLLYRLQNLRAMSYASFTLAMFALLFAATNVVLVVLNAADHHAGCAEGRDVRRVRCASATSELVFHRLEFWASFCFAVVTAFSLMSTPKAVSHIYSNPTSLKLLLLLQICFALVPAMLVTVNLDLFEVPAHELEYLNELTVSFVDVVLLASLLRLDDDDDDDDDTSVAPSRRRRRLRRGDADEAARLARRRRRRPATSSKNARSGYVFAGVAVGVACCQLVIYNAHAWVPAAEKAAHFFEFAFNIASAFVTFWFCMDNRFEADKEIMEILYGTHRDCVHCRSAYDDLEGYRLYAADLRHGKKPTTLANTLRCKLGGGGAVFFGTTTAPTTDRPSADRAAPPHGGSSSSSYYGTTASGPSRLRPRAATVSSVASTERPLASSRAPRASSDGDGPAAATSGPTASTTSATEAWHVGGGLGHPDTCCRVSAAASESEC